jgi:hypothetical protein
MAAGIHWISVVLLLHPLKASYGLWRCGERRHCGQALGRVLRSDSQGCAAFADASKPGGLGT